MGHWGKSKLERSKVIREASKINRLLMYLIVIRWHLKVHRKAARDKRIVIHNYTREQKMRKSKVIV